MRKLWLRAAVLSGLALATGAPARAADTLTLRIAHTYPATHYLVTTGIRPWAAEVTRLTNGKVTFQEFPAGQLGAAKDMLDLAKSGAVDIAYVGPSYVSDRMPLSEVIAMPRQFRTSCEGTLAYWKAARNGPVRKDYDDNGVRLLLAAVNQPYEVVTHKPIASLEDVKGLKLRSGGGVMDIVAKSVGAVPVRMSAPEVYESLSRGTMDGVIFPLESVKPYNVDNILKNSTRGARMSSFVNTLVIGKQVWADLPEDVRKAMDEAAEDIEPKWCAAIDQSMGKVVSDLEANGVKFRPVPADLDKALENASEQIVTDWAKALDRRNQPGTETVTAFRKALGNP